jgi:phosphohistidine phosphatase SixA
MNLYLVRNTDAAPVGEEGVERDEDRPLSGPGREQLATLADGLRRLGVAPRLVLAAPLRRCAETAEELGRRLGVPAEDVRTLEQLAPDYASKKLAKHLITADVTDLLLVGRASDLARHAAWLIGDKNVRVRLAKGGVAHLVCDGAPQKGGADLVDLLTPEWLATLAASR